MQELARNGEDHIRLSSVQHEAARGGTHADQPVPPFDHVAFFGHLLEQTLVQLRGKEGQEWPAPSHQGLGIEEQAKDQQANKSCNLASPVASVPHVPQSGHAPSQAVVELRGVLVQRRRALDGTLRVAGSGSKRSEERKIDTRYPRKGLWLRVWAEHHVCRLVWTEVGWIGSERMSMA